MSENTAATNTAEENAPPHGIPTPEAGGSESGAGMVTGPMPDEEAIREALKDVIDPEIGINIVDLGLIYDVEPNDETREVNVNMTLTSPGCPVGPELKSAVWLTVKRMNGVADCEVNLVWKPRWDPSVHASEEAQMFLGIW
jgi:metal-sulfur cluster biosynthetic enzyme